VSTWWATRWSSPSCTTGEDVDLDQLAMCLSNFRSLSERALKDATPLVFAYYREATEDFSDDEREEYGIPEIADPSEGLGLGDPGDGGDRGEGRRDRRMVRRHRERM
jgi:hypothetical protein